ncbi:MAG: hypothetical protein ACO1TE_24030 [Prosthecobacter sp.]
MRAFFSLLPGLFLALGLSACSCRTFDPATGTAHLWGLGHLSMSVRPAADDATLQAVVVGADTLGLGVDTAPFASSGGVGYHGSRVAYVLREDAPLRIDPPRQGLRRGACFQTFDEATGTTHLWGLGHLALSVGHPWDKSKLQAVIVGTETVGLGLDTAPFASGCEAGYGSTRVAYVTGQDTALRIDRPHRRNFALHRAFVSKSNSSTDTTNHRSHSNDNTTTP